MTIAANTTITQIGYHSILDTIKTVLSTSSTGYGVLPVSDYVGTGTLITIPEWITLYNDINRVYFHQTGDNISYPTGTFPVIGGKLYRGFVNAIADAATYAAANPYTVDPGQLDSASEGSSTPNTNFTDVVTSTITLSWPSEEVADYNFNLGGYVQTDLSATMPPSPNATQTSLVNLINNFRNTVKVPFDRDLWLSTKTAPGRTYSVTTSVVTTIGTLTDYFAVTNTYQIIDKEFTNDSVKVTTEIIPPAIVDLIPDFPLAAAVTVTNFTSKGISDLDYFSSATLTTSSGSLAGAAPGVSESKEFSDVNPNPRQRQVKTLSVNPSSLYYIMTGGSTSTTKSFTITNNNVSSASWTATITDIIVGRSIAAPTLSYDSLPITLAPGQSTTVNLYWDKPEISYRELGETSSPIVIRSNNTLGDIVVPTRVLIQEPAGAWNFSPSSATTVLTTYKKLTQIVRIVPSFARVRNIISCTLSQTGTNFSISKRPNAVDPTVVLSYEPFDTSNGEKVATLTVTAEIADTTGDYIQSTKTFTFTVDQNLVDSNLGNWISPLGSVNSVIGVSYDVIGGIRYLTVGVGVGADGSPNVDEGGGDPKYANVNYLGINSNSLIASNYAFTQYTSGDADYDKFGQFLKDYGIKSPQYYISPTDPACKFDIDIATTGTYILKYAVYETGYVEIDGNKVINLSAIDSNNWQSVATKTINLTTGTHTLRFVGNLRMAATLTDQSGALICSTLDIIQAGPSYKNWWEVYRFPINMDGQFKLLNSKEYRVKDTATARSVDGKKLFPYGDFFGYSAKNFGNIFEVRSDGKGQVTLSVVPPIQEGNIGDTVTVSSLYFSFYYKQFSVPRYTHKTGGKFDNDPNYTDFFLGFDKYGTVRTDKRLIPKEFSYGKKNNVLDKVITFFISNLITDYIIVELALFKSWYLYTFDTGVGLVGVLYSQNISLGAYILENLGVNIGASQTVSGYIINFFSSFFEGSAVASAGATSVLSAAAPVVQAAGGTSAVNAQLAEKLLTGGLPDTLPAGAEFILEAKTAGVYEQVVLGNAEYLGGAEVATANIAIETGAAADAASASVITGEGAVILSNVAGVALTVVGIKLIADGLKDGDIGSIAVGAAATYAGYSLAETLFLAALEFVCFAENTEVELADGTLKLIKDIEIGDFVKNAKGTEANRVTFIEKHTGITFPSMYSPDEKVKPFATLNHPLYINGELYAPFPDYYLWLDVKPLEKFYSEVNNSSEVYNLWVTGDHTYRVNGFGTTSIMDGGALLNSINHGIVKNADVSQILADMVQDNPTTTYGSYLINQYLGKLNTKLVTRPLIFFACADRGTLRRLTFKQVSHIVGLIAKLINRK